MIYYLPIVHGDYPEEREKISDEAYESEKMAIEVGKELMESSYEYTGYVLKEIEIVPKEENDQ